LIERALSNFIDNVCNAPGSHPVRASLRREGTQAEIVVENGGPGLPGELHQRLACRCMTRPSSAAAAASVA
jgi:K+-sensing histidine kinase KdpD